jgi:hypothetical protein
VCFSARTALDIETVNFFCIHAHHHLDALVGIFTHWVNFIHTHTQVFFLSWAWATPDYCSSRVLSLKLGGCASPLSPCSTCFGVGLPWRPAEKRSSFLRLRGGGDPKKRPGHGAVNENEPENKKARPGQGGWGGVTGVGGESSDEEEMSMGSGDAGSFADGQDDDDDDDGSNDDMGEIKERTGADDTDSYVTRYAPLCPPATLNATQAQHALGVPPDVHPWRGFSTPLMLKPWSNTIVCVLHAIFVNRNLIAQ